jgi:hypothetical protein
VNVARAAAEELHGSVLRAGMVREALVLSSPNAVFVASRLFVAQAVMQFWSNIKSFLRRLSLWIILGLC